MKSIKFSDKEIEFLVSLYETEVQDAEAYVVQVKQILSKLRKQEDIVNADGIKVLKKRGRKPKIREEVLPREPKKRGRKPKVKEEVVPRKPKKRGRKPEVNLIPAEITPVAPLKADRKANVNPEIKRSVKAKGSTPKVKAKKAAKKKKASKGKKIAAPKIEQIKTPEPIVPVQEETKE